jgi:hypothetical protein
MPKVGTFDKWFLRSQSCATGASRTPAQSSFEGLWTGRPSSSGAGMMQFDDMGLDEYDVADEIKLQKSHRRVEKC